MNIDNLLWFVINPDNTYAGIPCLSFEEARELANQKEGRKIFVIDPILDEVTDSENGLL